MSRGIKYFSFVVAMIGTSFVLTSPAQAAGPTQVFVSVCGNNNTWYVNPDEWTKDTADDGQGDRRPLSTSDGMVFSPADLIHHQLDFAVTSSLVAGTYVANPAPDINDFFSVEVVNDDHTGYGTLRWDSSANQWEVTKSGVTTVGLDPKALLEGLGLSTHGRSFGVGYTNSPAGTVASLVSSINFMGSVYKLSCPGVSPSPVPGPTKTIIKTVTVTPSPSSAQPTASPSDDPYAGLNTGPVTITEIPYTLNPQPKLVAKSSSLTGWGWLVAIVVGLGLIGAGIFGIVKNRRRYEPGHYADNSKTTLMPAVGGDEHDLSDYHPSRGYDPALGGYPGESRPENQNTEEIPPASGDDTRPMPPVE